MRVHSDRHVLLVGGAHHEHQSEHQRFTFLSQVPSLDAIFDSCSFLVYSAVGFNHPSDGSEASVQSAFRWIAAFTAVPILGVLIEV